MPDGFTFEIEFDMSDVVKKTREADRHIDKGLKNSVEFAAEQTVKSAKQNHTFQNRTKNLEDSIHAEPVIAGHLDAECEVIAGEDYASYVEKKMPYLQVALDEAEPRLERDLNDYLQSAEYILSK